MRTITSNDGTAIAFEQSGSGPAAILVSGTLDQQANGHLASLLAPHFTVFNYQRRGHGASGDTAPWAIERELEDLTAVITVAGGSAFVFGSSGNGIFVLEAAARGLAPMITKLAVWEPPYLVDDSRPPLPADYKTQLTTLLAEGRRGDMVELFFTKAVGMPADVVAQMRQAPFFAGLEAIAHTLIYDATIQGDMSVPTQRLATMTTPTLVIDGGQASSPWIRRGLDTLVAVLPDAQRHALEGQPHNVDPAALTPALIEFYTR